jgi:hypothetical protein
VQEQVKSAFRPIVGGAVMMPLRWMVLVVLLLAGSALAVRLGPIIARENNARRVVSRVGGYAEPYRRGPRWLRRWVGDERMGWLDGIASVAADKTSFGDAELACLRGLADLEELSLNETNVTDDGMRYLEDMPSLRYLFLNHTRISSAGLAHIKGLRNLESLSLVNTDVGDEGMKYLAELSHLEYLDVCRTRVTDDAIPHIKQMPALTECRAYGSDMSMSAQNWLSDVFSDRE